MQMPSRTYNTTDYRFGYNGMEKDSEIKGDGNSYTTEFRQYDPRLGRWLSLDPLMAELSEWSPYVAFENNPVLYNDPLGLKVGKKETEGDPIKTTQMQGNRTLEGVNGEIDNEILALPGSGNKTDDVYAFKYDNAIVEYTYIDNPNKDGDEGQWAVEVYRTKDNRTWTMYINSNRTNYQITPMKRQPPPTVSNLDPLEIAIRKPKPPSGTPPPGPPPSAPPPPSTGGGGHPIPPKAPPCIQSYIPFIDSRDYFTPDNRKKASDLLKPYGKYLGEAKNDFITINVYTARGEKYRPSDYMLWGADKYDKMTGAQLSAARADRIMSILQNIDPSITNKNVIFNPVFNKGPNARIGFDIETGDCR